MNAVYAPRGRYFEEFTIGLALATAGRTITEADIVNFATLTGDFNQIHVDAEFAAQSLFGKRVAHGMLVQSYALGLTVQSGAIEGTIMAFRELECKFSEPVFIGDTIHTEIEVIEAKNLPRLGGGNVTLKYQVINQNGKVVQRGQWVMLVKSKAAGS